MKYDRLEMGNGRESAETWLWCLHCERCYQLKETRVIGEYQMYAYNGCNGDTVFDARN
jgi:hypothetical protein